MELAFQGLVVGLVLFGLLGLGVWVAVALVVTGAIVIATFTAAPAGTIFATVAWGSVANWTLTALPLYIWMGEILYRTRLAEDMFAGLAPWLGRLPGRLLHVNVVGCGIFAAVSGSSAATAVTIGRISLPRLRERGYSDRIAIGSLAGASTLGLLIPPSIVLIVYGVAAQVSINRLFIAGVVPGLMVAALFSGYIAFWSWRHPDVVPVEQTRATLGERLKGLRLLLPVVLLIAGVIGSIYSGVATATEAAALGVVGALFIAGFSGSLSRANFIASVLGATRTSCMITFILLGASYLTNAMSFSGLPTEIAAWIAGSGMNHLELIAVLTLFFIVLGCFLDGISIVVLTAAILLPAIKAVGLDPIWFGIYLVLVVEMAQITPPVGFNLFVLQGLTGKSIFEIARYALPFFLLLLTAVVLLTAFPGIATWLVYAMMTRG